MFLLKPVVFFMQCIWEHPEPKLFQKLFWQVNNLLTAQQFFQLIKHSLFANCFQWLLPSSNLILNNLILNLDNCLSRNISNRANKIDNCDRRYCPGESIDDLKSSLSAFIDFYLFQENLAVKHAEARYNYYTQYWSMENGLSTLLIINRRAYIRQWICTVQ